MYIHILLQGHTSTMNRRRHINLVELKLHIIQTTVFVNVDFFILRFQKRFVLIDNKVVFCVSMGSIR